jgi:TolB-like protein/Flp pilus assembly protein TadD
MAEGQAPEPAVIPGRDVFISYASQDKVVADAVCEALEKAGVVCWIAPRDVTPGEFYAESIVHAIDSTKVIVLVLSQHSADSQHVLREVERASSKRHPVVSFRLDSAQLPAGLEYFLNSSQWLDASTTGVAGSLPRLLDAVKTALSQPVTSARTAAAPPAITRSSGRGRPVLIALAVLASAALAYLAVTKFWLPKAAPAPSPVASPSAPTAAISDKSIAVLPFADMSEKHDQEYFADGMAEEILDLLAKIPGLHVPARTSSFYFKGKSEDIPTIARRLMVANVLEGSVRKSGNQVRVTVQLVRADNGYHLWSETYDRTLNDLFKVQDEIAGEVVKALKISMGTTSAPRAVPTNSAEAHRLLLQAQFWYYRGTADDLKKAASYYQQAIDIDPNFAEAWAGLSAAGLFAGQYNAQTRQHNRALTLGAAERAIALDPKLAAAHCALGSVRYRQDWDWSAAITEYEMALSLDPNNSDALLNVGLLTALQGRPTDALQYWEQAAGRDSLNYYVYEALADTYYAMGRFTEALAAMRKSVELAPTVEGMHAILAQMLLGAGQSDDALAEAKKEGDPSFRSYGLARTYIVLGHRGDADAALTGFEKNFSAEQPYNIATLHALRGERDQAFSWLNRAYQQHDPIIVGMPPITVDPDLRNLHDDPRWAAFLRKMNLP